MTAQERWRAAARAASFLYRAGDARTTTQAGWLLEDAAMLLCEAGLCDLADEVYTASEAWDHPVSDWIMDRLSTEIAKLETAYLETEL